MGSISLGWGFQENSWKGRAPPPFPPHDAPLTETPTVDDRRVDGHSERECESVAMIKSYCALCLT